MGNKDWQLLDSKDDLAALGVSPHRGRGWRILSGLLFVAAATFAGAYYMPLYRAHSTLSREYRTLSNQASTQHKQLTETLDTLKQVSAERDRLNTIAGTKQKSSETLTPQSANLERDLQTPLKKFIGPGKLQMTRHKETLRVILSSPTLVPAAGSDLTDTGKKAVCLIGTALKSADIHISIQGYGTATQPRGAPAWKLAAARAAATAQFLSESCGVDPNRVEVLVRDQSHASGDAAVLLEITPI